MKPENVNPRNFNLEEVLYDNNEFSIAYGKFENGENSIAMRWNGSENDAGYPKTFGNPMWFVIHNDLKQVILKSLIGVKYSKKDALLKILASEI